MPEPIAPPPEQLRFVPYAQLVKMLVPSAGTISLYGPADDLLWCSDGCERPDLRGLLEPARRGAPAPDAPADGAVVRSPTGLAAYLKDLESEAGERLGCLVVELPTCAHGPRHSVAPSLLRPVVDCLEARLRLEHGARGAPAADSLDALLEEDEADGPAAIERALHACIGAMSADVAALVVPAVRIEAHAAAGPAASATAALERARTHLLPWVELNDRPMAANRVPAAGGAAARKILACPIRDTRQRVTGVIALFRAPSAADFDAHDTALIEVLGRKLSMLLNRRHDPLTGLLSRAAFERQAAALLDADGSQHALVYLDVDHLHQVNEAFGFDCGDRILAFVAAHVRASIGADSPAGRLGGDRFAVMLAGTAFEDARAATERLLAAVTESDYVHLDQAIPVSVTAGIAAARGRSVRHMIAAAELAAKRAKQRGPGRVAVARNLDGVAALARDREQLAYSDFEDALAGNALGLEAQPIVGLGHDAGRLLGFEVFVRMRSASGDWLSAHRFLSSADYYGMMPAIDRWVVGTTVEMLRGCAGDLPDLPLGVNINVSPQSLRSGGYPRFVLDALGGAGLPTGLVGFELKESMAWNHLADVDRFAQTFRAAGARVTLDNFRSGVPSVVQLRSLPIRRIKIDGPLLRRCGDDADAAALVEGITRAARGLGIATIAEQVDTAEIGATLGALGFDHAQGYHFGRPAPLADWLVRPGPVLSHGTAAG